VQPDNPDSGTVFAFAQPVTADRLRRQTDPGTVQESISDRCFDAMVSHDAGNVVAFGVFTYECAEAAI
jgi:hypothetical protein